MVLKCTLMIILGVFLKTFCEASSVFFFVFFIFYNVLFCFLGTTRLFKYKRVTLKNVPFWFCAADGSV